MFINMVMLGIFVVYIIIGLITFISSLLIKITISSKCTLSLEKYYHNDIHIIIIL